MMSLTATTPERVVALASLLVATQLVGFGCGDTLVNVLVPAGAGGEAGHDGEDGGGTADCVPPLIACAGDCADLSMSNAHCGACNVACSGGSFCSAGSCTCRDGDTMCSGVCTSLDADPQNCGNCAIRCEDGQSCHHGVCGTGCPPPTVLCDGECVDPESSEASGESCEEDESCSDGECGCLAPLVSCGEACVDLLTDKEHCGDCEVQCADEASCVDGVCR